MHDEISLGELALVHIVKRRLLAGAADSAALERLNDGPGKYSLVGFISHMGANTACGHYVAHIRKEGRWVIYNDEKACIWPTKRISATHVSKSVWLRGKLVGSHFHSKGRWIP